jgi:SAM-dependent methyltransferase
VIADVRRELHRGLDALTAERRKFIRKAFDLLPRLNHPRILDVGCGRGEPTLELARLSSGDVVGLDIDGRALEELAAAAANAGLSDRVRVRCCSMDAIDFADGAFDIIWAEASIHVIGFEQGLKAWRRLLVAGGFLVVHEMAWLRPAPPREIAAHWQSRFPGIHTVDGWAAEIPRLGYRLLHAFALPEAFWWDSYFHPLERRIETLRQKCEADEAALAALGAHQREVELHRKYGAWFGSAYWLMQKSPE